MAWRKGGGRVQEEEEEGIEARVCRGTGLDWRSWNEDRDGEGRRQVCVPSEERSAEGGQDGEWGGSWKPGAGGRLI